MVTALTQRVIKVETRVVCSVKISIRATITTGTVKVAAEIQGKVMHDQFGPLTRAMSPKTFVSLIG